MSLVGTRPILQDELRQYELHHRARIAIKPGITGMWQVSGRSDITDFEEVVRLDTEYISTKPPSYQPQMFFNSPKPPLSAILSNSSVVAEIRMLPRLAGLSSFVLPWGVIFMYAFQLYKHRRKFRYFSDCVADSYEKVFGIILTICRIRHIIIIKRKEHSNVREHFI